MCFILFIVVQVGQVFHISCTLNICSWAHIEGICCHIFLNCGRICLYFPNSILFLFYQDQNPDLAKCRA